MNQNITLKDFPSRVENNGDMYRVIYEQGEYSGMCEYKLFQMSGTSKPISQRVLLMTSCDMGDIIEYVHKKTPLCSDNFKGVNMEIREDSRRRVEEYLTNQYPHSPR